MIRSVIRVQKLNPRQAKLRVEVEHGAFGLDLTEEDVNPDTDLLYEDSGVTIVVDQTSAAQLAGVQIDYKASASGEGFVFNPRGD